MATINKPDKLARKLQAIVKSTRGLPIVKIGFLSTATYPDGTPVAAVAAANEWGVPSKGQPPRPFFRQMVAEKKPTWGDAIAKQMKATDYDVPQTLDRMGQGIKGQLQVSIRNLTDPPLAASTIAKKGFDKPLISTSHMLNSVDYEVKDT